MMEVVKTVKGMAVVIVSVNVRSSVVGIKLVTVVMRVVLSDFRAEMCSTW